MYPILFHIGPIPIRAYGLFIILGSLAGVWLAHRRASRFGIDPEFVLDVFLPALAAGVAGARLLYVLLEYLQDPTPYWQDPWLPFKVWRGGLSFHGGLFAGLAVVLGMAKRRGVPLLPFMDLAAPAVPLAHAIARIGCFLNGCCYGRPTDLPWACVFEVEASGRWTPPSHPTQVYAALGNLLICGAILWFQGRPRPEGTSAWLYFLLYSVKRFVVEHFRAGATAVVTPLGGLTVGQIASLLIGLAAMGLLGWSVRRKGPLVGELREAVSASQERAKRRSVSRSRRPRRRRRP